MSDSRHLTLILCLAAACGLNACSRDNASYDRSVSNGSTTSCEGYCAGSEALSEDDCSEQGGVWTKSECRGADGKLIPDMDEATCTAPSQDVTDENAKSNLWIDGYCTLDKAQCSAAGKNWVDYALIDMGYGRYIRRVSAGGSETYQCGEYKEVMSGAAAPCDAQTIDSHKKNFEYQLCMKGTACHGAYYNGNPIEAAICSNCAPNMAQCKVGDAWQCSDLENNPKHCGSCDTECGELQVCRAGKCTSTCELPNKVCGNGENATCVAVLSDPQNCGECGNKCDENQYCDNGGCEDTCSLTLCKVGDQALCLDIQNNPEHCGKCNNPCGDAGVCKDGICKSYCDAPKFYCKYGETEEEKACVDPSSIDTCGAKTCEDAKTITKCGEGFICKQNSDDYSCTCESGIVVKSEKNGFETCIDPSTNVHCGATTANPEGMNCGEGTACKKYSYTDDDNIVQEGYHCSCTTAWELSCYNEKDAGATCIDTSNDSDHCSAKDCADTSFACADDRICKAGHCECSGNLVECNGECIDPLDESNYCGAKGTCTDDDPSSDNYRGKKCGENEGCSNGECVCSNNSNIVSCNGRCIQLHIDTSCTVTIKDNDVCEIVDCTNNGKVCKLSDETGNYYCGCPENTVKCGDACIDSKTDIEHCGAKGACNSEFSDNDSYQGEDCSKRTDGNTLCSDGKCTNGCPSGQVNCNGVCVNQDEYHLNDNCTDCIFSFVTSKFYCYAGERDENHQIINFDYHKCLMQDADKNDLNKLGSNYFCGETCVNAHECTNGRHCNTSNKCVCDNITEIECPANRTELGNAEAESFCINKADTHQLDCDVCEAGWADLDGNILNGCEIDIMNDVKHCGENNIDCTERVKNASGIFCNQGVCDYAYCTSNHGDCDENRSDGCEMSGLVDDALNCGTCGHVCDGGSCVNGVCCDGNGKTATKADDLNCCEGLGKYYYEHTGWWIFTEECTDSSHYSCLNSNPNDACWSLVK